MLEMKNRLVGLIAFACPNMTLRCVTLRTNQGDSRSHPTVSPGMTCTMPPKPPRGRGGQARQDFRRSRRETECARLTRRAHAIRSEPADEPVVPMGNDLHPLPPAAVLGVKIVARQAAAAA
jgi:hypothetical protein